METTATIRTRFRVRLFNAAVLILALSVSGWSQQPATAGQKYESAGKHTGTIEYRNTIYGLSFTLPESWKGATESCGRSGKAVCSGTMAAWREISRDRSCR
jgi:hypothetical protein